MPSGVPGSGPASFNRRSLKQIIARVDRKVVDEGQDEQPFGRATVDQRLPFQLGPALARAGIGEIEQQREQVFEAEHRGKS